MIYFKMSYLQDVILCAAEAASVAAANASAAADIVSKHMTMENNCFKCKFEHFFALNSALPKNSPDAPVCNVCCINQSTSRTKHYLQDYLIEMKQTHNDKKYNILYTEHFFLSKEE